MWPQTDAATKKISRFFWNRADLSVCGGPQATISAWPSSVSAGGVGWLGDGEGPGGSVVGGLQASVPEVPIFSVALRINAR